MAACALLVLSAPPARSAGPAPAALRGNSILLKWDETRTLANVDNPERQFLSSFAASVSLYVGSTGRIFSTFERSSGAPQAAASNVSDGSEKDVTEETLHWRFEGGALSGYLTFVSGVRKISVVFSDGFKSCSMTTFYGKDRGAPVVIRSRTNGWQFTLLQATINSTSCLVREGNVFGKAE